MRRHFLLLAGLLAGCSSFGPAATPTPAATASPDEVVVAPDSPKFAELSIRPIQVRPMPVSEVTAPGKVETNPNYISQVTLPVPGRVGQVLVRLGDSVRAGQPLVTVIGADVGEAVKSLRESEAILLEGQATVQEARARETQAQAALIQARAALSKAQTAHRKAQADLLRVRDLYEHNAVAHKELLNADTDLRQAAADIVTAEAGVKQAQAGITQAQSGVSQAQAGLVQIRAGIDQAHHRLDLLGVPRGNINAPVVVHSPLSGKVTDIRVVAGEYHSDPGVPVMTVADLRSVWVTSNVPESAIRLIGIGEPVHITLDAYPGQTFRGKVTRLADVLDPKTRTLKVAIELANPRGQLRPEMFGRIHHLEQEKPMPVVPASAVLESDRGAYLFVETSPGHFQRRAVELGAHHAGLVAVTRGARAGDRVVADGAILLR